MNRNTIQSPATIWSRLVASIMLLLMFCYLFYTLGLKPFLELHSNIPRYEVNAVIDSREQHGSGRYTTYTYYCTYVANDGKTYPITIENQKSGKSVGDTVPILVETDHPTYAIAKPYLPAWLFIFLIGTFIIVMIRLISTIKKTVDYVHSNKNE